MYQLQSRDVFYDLLRALQDRKGRARILARLESVQLGNLGDVKSVGAGVREMRIHFDSGCRVYFIKKVRIVLLLPCGGDESTQTLDLARAQCLLKELDQE